MGKSFFRSLSYKTKGLTNLFEQYVLYGAQAPKLVSMLKIALPEAEKLYEDYWNAVPSQKKLKEVVENFWTATQEKYVRAADGRLLTSRSKHSLLNVLLQSCGSLVTKYVTLLIQQRLEEEGALGNVFVDTAEESKTKVYQSIVYHKFVVALQGNLH